MRTFLTLSAATAPAHRKNCFELIIQSSARLPSLSSSSNNAMLAITNVFYTDAWWRDLFRFYSEIAKENNLNRSMAHLIINDPLPSQQSICQLSIARMWVFFVCFVGLYCSVNVDRQKAQYPMLVMMMMIYHIQRKLRTHSNIFHTIAKCSHIKFVTYQSWFAFITTHKQQKEQANDMHTLTHTRTHSTRLPVPLCTQYYNSIQLTKLKQNNI